MPKPIEITSECLSVALNRFEVDECDGYPSMEQVWSKAEIMYFGIPICEYDVYPPSFIVKIEAMEGG